MVKRAIISLISLSVAMVVLLTVYGVHIHNIHKQYNKNEQLVEKLREKSSGSKYKRTSVTQTN